MESQPQYPELRINPENFHPCIMSPDLVLDLTCSGSKNSPISNKSLLSQSCLSHSVWLWTDGITLLFFIKLKRILA